MTQRAPLTGHRSVSRAGQACWTGLLGGVVEDFLYVIKTARTRAVRSDLGADVYASGADAGAGPVDTVKPDTSQASRDR